MASGLAWKVEILERLQNRDRQEFVSFKDLIKSRMFDSIYFDIFMFSVYLILFKLLLSHWLVCPRIIKIKESMNLEYEDVIVSLSTFLYIFAESFDVLI